MKTNNVWEGVDLPKKLERGKVYKLLPNKKTKISYKERTNRNLGWITEEEQKILKHTTIGVAGCGGMGGLIAATLARLGVGEIRITDPDNFDESNINRQFAAKRVSIGKSKVLETAQDIRNIADDFQLVIYPDGINSKNVEDFIDGCDVVCDLIDFWAIGARLLLHRASRNKNKTIINCDTVGHRTFLFRFTSDGLSLGDMINIDFNTAIDLEHKIIKDLATEKEKETIVNEITKIFMPNVPEYFSKNLENRSTKEAFFNRTLREGKIPIIATNPPMASGFACNHILFEILHSRSKDRNIVIAPQMPGYLMFDAGLMKAEVFKGVWWTD